MHARELVELAALVATQAHTITNSRHSFGSKGLEQYWTASKCRLDRWGLALTNHANRVRDFPHDNDFFWKQVRPVLEEILASEVLTRVWTALGCIHSASEPRNDVVPVVRNVLAGHLEATSRALNLILHGTGLKIEDAVALNRLRRRNERWTDVLLEQCAQFGNVAEFFSCPHRMKQLDGHQSPFGELRQSLMLASLRMSYQNGLEAFAANPDLNQRIAAGILQCLGADHFDTAGLPRSTWIERLYETANDTQGMVDELLGLESTSTFERPGNLGRYGQTDRF